MNVRKDAVGRVFSDIRFEERLKRMAAAAPSDKRKMRARMEAGVRREEWEREKRGGKGKGYEGLEDTVV